MAYTECGSPWSVFFDGPIALRWPTYLIFPGLLFRIPAGRRETSTSGPKCSVGETRAPGGLAGVERAATAAGAPPRLVKPPTLARRVSPNAGIPASRGAGFGRYA